MARSSSLLEIDMQAFYFLAFVVVVASAAPLEEEGGVRMDDMVFTYDPLKAPRNANMNVRKWVNGVVPYVFNSASPFTQAHKDIILNSMRTIEKDTGSCLTFKERTTEADYITIEDSTRGCWSYIGRIGGSQRLSLQISAWCVHHGVVIHELLHAVGFEHEQNRDDRDFYVMIVSANIQPGQEYNFNKLSAAVVNKFGEEYDYQSIMHYRYNEFSANTRATIVPIQTGVDLNTMGQKNKLTDKDIRKIKKFYTCPV